MRGISTREYHEVLPRMAETVGVSRSAVSRQAIEASVEQLKQLRERRWDQVEVLVIYIDGQRFSEHHILSAVGVDLEGHKHVLGIASGVTENAAAVKQLLTGVRDRGLPTDRKYLFIIDGAKALRTAIEEVFGREQEVQRCRNHKIENVMSELPREQQEQTRRLMRAAFKLSSAEERREAAGADRAPTGVRLRFPPSMPTFPSHCDCFASHSTSSYPSLPCFSLKGSHSPSESNRARISASATT
jgi:transposase-like protein